VRCGPSKSRKTPWALVVPGPPARSLACKLAHACMRVHARAFAFARCVYLRRPGPRSLRPRCSFPGIALSGSSAKIIKGASASRGPIDPVNSVTTTIRASLDAENALLHLFVLLFPLSTSSSHLAIERTPRGLWLSKSYQPVVKLYVRARTRGDSER